MVKEYKKTIKDYKYWLLLIAISMLLWIIISSAILYQYKENETIYLHNTLEALDSQINSTLRTYELFSNYIFEEKINRPEIKKLMFEAYYSDLKKQEPLRKELYELISNDYLLMQRYNFRQLHFHFPNGVSFLRVHEPSRYGDNLFSVRHSVRIANTEEKYVSGFEEGRLFNGYRFVYPMYHEGHHIGSVEVSISIATLVEVLNDLFPNNEYYFIIDKDIVFESVFKEYYENYEESFFSTKYLLDKNIPSYQNLKLGQRDTLVKLINYTVEPYLESKSSFSLFREFENDCYIISFLSINNIVGTPTGYFISLSRDNQLKVISRRVYIDLLQVSLLFLLFVISSFIFTFDRIKLRGLSSTDSLTKLYNRHQFIYLAEQEMLKSKKNKTDLSIIMCDIDYFKKVNDNHGHLVGDKVLIEISNLIRENIRQQDILARWGGEEFIVLLPETSIIDAEKSAERIRNIIEKNTFEEVGKVTISLGAAQLLVQDTSLNKLIENADKALYKAKELGRNKVCI